MGVLNAQKRKEFISGLENYDEKKLKFFSLIYLEVKLAMELCHLLSVI